MRECRLRLEIGRFDIGLTFRQAAEKFENQPVTINNGSIACSRLTMKGSSGTSLHREDFEKFRSQSTHFRCFVLKERLRPIESNNILQKFAS